MRGAHCEVALTTPLNLTPIVVKPSSSNDISLGYLNANTSLLLAPTLR